MEVYRLRTNHLKVALGYMFGIPVFSWCVRDAEGTVAEASRLVVMRDGKQIADTGWAALDSLATQIDGLTLEPRTRYEWNVSVRTNAGEESTSQTAWFETGKMDEPWNASWITCDGAESPRHPVFSTSFSLVGDVASARLYACGLGLYDATLNGIRVSDEHLAPGTNAYDQWLQVQTYDVTDALAAAGDSVTLSFLMGNGWWKGRFGFIPEDRGFYGSDWRLIAELHITYADGTEQVVGSGEDWRLNRSKVYASNIYDGEYVDDTLPAVAPVSATLLAADEARVTTAKLTDRLSLPVTAHETFMPTIVDVPSGNLVLDMGQEFAGTFRLRVHEPAGTTVHIWLGELLQDGEFYNENLRSAKQEYVYVSDGDEHVLEPRFTYYGYRYAKIVGLSSFVPSDFTGVALYSDFEEAGSLTTGHALVNKLVSNTRWGMKSNFVDTPTDCPQRDERMGWTGDAQVFAPTALYLADQQPFYRKFAYDMAREADKFGGAAPLVAPAFMLEGPACAVWGDATCFIPWQSYLFSGDKSVLAEHFDYMKSWVDHIEKVDDGSNHAWGGLHQLGDWLALDAPKGDRTGATDPDFIAYLYWWRSATEVAEAARVLGIPDDAYRYDQMAQRVLDYINAEYFTPNGRCAVTTQTAYALCIAFGFGSPEFSAFALDRALARNEGKLVTGFVGTNFLTRALCMAGMPSKAYDLLLNEEYPGWLREVKLGATTIWERWNSLDDDGVITGVGMNSMNHYSYGSIVEWLFGYAAGLRPDASEPGFRRAIVAPIPSWRIGHLECEYTSSAGTWRVSWNCLDENHLRIGLTVPFGCTASLELPHAPESAYQELGGHELGAGTYEVSYQTSTPLRRVPSVDWAMGDLLASPDTDAVVRAHCKPDWIAPDETHLSMRQLAYKLARGSRPMSEEALAACDEALRALAEKGPND
ncbi:MAG: family 78 glycoside hydrolase catalytic domain [Atopobiaceae bacterium]|nr:family 78 glycoside hydrolase catalytic domain [Atopobiaceae bacterium]